jgi:DNA-binding MarR family transcriptional regulator
MHELASPGGLAATSGLTGERGAWGRLEALLAEVTALANQLRKHRTLAPGGEDSPSGGWVILQTLGDCGPQTVPDIARARALSRQNVQILVNRLEQEGCVEVIPNPAHKRSGLVQLTDRGRRLLAGVLEREAASMESLLAHIPHARLAPAAELLRQLRELIAGRELPPAEIAEARPVRRPGTARHKPVRPQRAATAAELPAAAEPIGSEGGELPFNLL